MPLIICKKIQTRDETDSADRVKLLRPNGIGISLANNKIFEYWLEEIKFKLDRGDLCLLFTDGLNEMRNGRNEEFGLIPLKQILTKSVYSIRAENLIRELKGNVLQFLGDCSAHDDMTVVAIVREN